MPAYDVIVIGLGGHGSSVLYHAASRGLRVLGLEQFDLGHSLGSSHGTHRLIRFAYAEGAAYVPLLLRAAELWGDLERATGERLFIRSGVLSASPGGAGGPAKARAAADAHGIAYELLDAGEINRRFPAFNMAPGMAGLYQPGAGFVMSEATIAAHTMLAMAAGAEIRSRLPATSIAERDGRVLVATPAGTFTAGQVVVTAGAYIGKLLPALKPLHTVRRRVQGYFAPRRPADFQPGVCPGYTFRNEAIAIYGFPIAGSPGVKIGRGGHLGESGEPDELSRVSTARDEAALREGVRAFLRDCDGPCLRLAACIIADTPDEHFIIDRLPGSPNVHIVSMCSGHGFKFTPVTGEILADRLQGRPDRFDLAPFRLDRFATDAAGNVRV
jgi:sarcosine oxidase